MWWTPDGERILQGAEAVLFKEALSTIVDLVRDDDEAIRVMVETEIDQPAEWRESPSWRELVLAACRERGIEELLDPQSNGVDEWEVLVSSLADGVLWNEDWKDSESLLDADPKASRAVKKLLGIDEDYCCRAARSDRRRDGRHLGYVAGADSQRFVKAR